MFYTSIDRHGNFILYRGYEDNRPVKRKIQYNPTLYVPSRTPTEHRTLQGRHVASIQPGTMRDCYEFCTKHAEVEGFTIYGTQNYVHQFASDNFLDKCEWDRSIVDVTSVDIEVQSDSGFPYPNQAKFPVTAITLRSTRDGVYYCWGLGDYDTAKTIVQGADIKYVKCADENELLERFLLHWTRRYPDIVTGWNSRLFDTVYLVNRIKILFGESMADKLSPWGILKHSEIEIGGKSHSVYDIIGIQQLDYLDLFKKFGYTYGTQENYKLNTIAATVLGEKKIDYSEHSSLFNLYKEDHQKFIDYNIRDVQLVDKLEDKMGLITLAMTLAYWGLVNYSEVFGPVNMWDALIHNQLRRRGIVVPPKKSGHKERQIEGAHVKDPEPAMYRWMCSFDLNSLYPHLMMQYNMSPETILNKVYPGINVEKLLGGYEPNLAADECISATGQYFSTTIKGFIPSTVEYMYAQRSEFKKQALMHKQEKENTKDPVKIKELEKLITRADCQQMAIKILMNSLYGAMSNEYFRYFDVRIAESITVSGQLSIRWAERAINRYLNKLLKTDKDYVIAIDTDSLYINFEPLVEKMYKDASVEDIVKILDQICVEKIEPLVGSNYEALRKLMNAPQQKMVMKREVIADKGIWTGKKHYILNVHNSEGVQYAKPKLKIVGIEAVRSSTPGVCRKMIVDTLNVIMQSDEKTVQDYIAELRKQFDTYGVEDIAFPRGVSNMDKYADKRSVYVKATPINCRAALVYNHLLNRMNLASKYEPINTGEKIKFVYLKTPNTIGENVIGFPVVLPQELNVHKYVDYELQWQKAFLEPLRTILDAAGWQVEKTSTLEDFFS